MSLSLFLFKFYNFLCFLYFFYKSLYNIAVPRYLQPLNSYNAIYESNVYACLCMYVKPHRNQEAVSQQIQKHTDMSNNNSSKTRKYKDKLE